jgi:hypothetical protein
VNSSTHVPSTAASRLEFLRSQQMLSNTPKAVSPFASVDDCMNVKDGWEVLIDSRKDRVMQRKADKHVVQVATVDKKSKNIDPNFSAAAVTPSSSEQKYIPETVKDVQGTNTSVVQDNVVNLVDGFQMVAKGPYKLIKLLLRSPATNWGSSIWRLQVWGSRLDER